jgi:hypothetical protein
MSKSGIGFKEGVTVEDLSGLVKGGVCLLAAGGVAWNAVGEKRFLVKMSQDGRNESAKIIAEYEVKAPDLNSLGINQIIKAFHNSSNVLVIVLVALFLWKFVFSRRY